MKTLLLCYLLSVTACLKSEEGESQPTKRGTFTLRPSEIINPELKPFTLFAKLIYPDKMPKEAEGSFINVNCRIPSGLTGPKSGKRTIGNRFGNFWFTSHAQPSGTDNYNNIYLELDCPEQVDSVVTCWAFTAIAWGTPNRNMPIGDTASSKIVCSP